MFNLKLITLKAFSFISFIGVASSQTIPINNPSFEGTCGLAGAAAPGWTVCASSPDVQPGCFGVMGAPAHGVTYAGFCTGENIGQALPSTLNRGTAYSFTAFLRSDTFYGSADLGGCADAAGDAARGAAGRLQIWGGNTACTTSELLWQSPVISAQVWTQYSINITPTANSYNYIMLVQPVAGVSGANILVDNMSGNITVQTTLSADLILFSGKKQGNSSLLQWTTASEKNIESFEIERSQDGVNFLPIGKVAATSYSNSFLEYRFLDTRPIASKVAYYRIKMIDNNGNYNYTTVISIQLSMIKDVSISPMPINELSSLQFYSNSPSIGQVLIFNNIGQEMYQQQVLMTEGNNTLQLDLGFLPTGVYQLLLKTGNEELERVKIVKR